MIFLKKKRLFSFLSGIILSCIGCNYDDDESAADTLADNLVITFEVLTNDGVTAGLPCSDLGADGGRCNKVNMTLINEGKSVYSTDWTIYFHYIRQILDLENDKFKISHITGDLYQIEPTEKFDGFAKDDIVVLPLISEYWNLSETDFLSKAFIVSPYSPPKIIASLNNALNPLVTGLKGTNLKRSSEDNNILATATSRFEQNSTNTLQDVAANIIPTPMFIEDGKGTVSIVNGIALPYNFFDEEQFSAIKKRADIINVNLNGVLPVTITISPNDFTGNLHKSGSYTLSIQNDGIEIKGFDNTGVFYAVQSIFGLVNSQQALSLPQLNIKDAPRFDYRGIMIDVARNFRSKNIIVTTLDQMAAYKMNKLHLHLTDDEGWRLEISGLPELTDVGSNRCFDLNETNCLLPQLGSGPTRNNAGSGFFSREDYIDILKYAKARNIEVIPEIDMPAHSRSAVISMEARFKRLMEEGKTVEANEYRLLDPEDTSNVTTVQFYDKQSFINPCLESSTHFVNKVISEVAAMHTEAGVPLTTWHFGGDEAKNIKLGAGFQDINAENKVNSKGTIDLSAQDIPFSKSPQCKILIDKGIVNSFESLPNYFAEKVSNLVADENIPTFQAWQDGLKHSKNADDFATTNKRVNFWDPLFWGGASSVYEWSNKGYQVIISNPDYLYMDMPYEVDPKERGYYWATRAIDTRKIFTFTPENLPQNAETSVDRDGNGFIGKGEVNAKPFYGLSAQLWSETVRTDKQYEYMIFPRLLAVAERAWHRAEWENDYKEGLEYSQETNLVDKEVLLRDWRRFSNILGQRELAKLEQSGVNYRLPIPGAKIENGKLMMNIQFPGVNLQYSEDGEHWINYSDIQSPNVSADVFIRTISASGARSSRITKVSNRPSK